MGRIFEKEELQQFIQENKIDDCFSIILTVDEEKKRAFYVINGTKFIATSYEQAISSFDMCLLEN